MGERGFGHDIEVVQVRGGDKVPGAVAAVVKLLEGSYYKVDEGWQGRPLYRNVRIVQVDGQERLSSGESCIFWSGGTGRWNVGRLETGAVGCAYCEEDQETPTCVQGTWRVLRFE